MTIAASLWRKALIMMMAGVAVVSLYEVTILDSENAARQAARRDARRIVPGARATFAATAYCKGLVTTSGVAVQTGIAASDPALLPVGSVIQVASLGTPDDGIYTVLDTGPSVHGREIDIYMWSCNDALAFGRRPVEVTVLRLGWDPRATTPAMRIRPGAIAGDPLLPARPLPQGVADPR